MKKRELGYIEWMMDAERRTKAGQKQYQCSCHQTWHWWDQRTGHTLLVTPKTVKKWRRWRFVGKS